jgi:Zn-dependent M16 (insulinase) family peptidase
MSDTIKQKKPVLLPSIVPSRSYIQKRMAKRFGVMAQLEVMQAVTEACAEEAEKIFFEILNELKQAPLQTASISVKKHRTSSRYKINDYVCPVCQSEDVRLYVNFCSSCGTPIEWIS